MPKFSELSEENQQFFEKLIEAVLTCAGAKDYFRIVKTGNLHIRHSTSNRPTQVIQARVEAILKALAAKGFISFERSAIGLSLFGQTVPVSSLKITNVNEDMLRASLIKVGLVQPLEKPDEVDDERIWAVMPEKIQKCWRSFNDELKAHILKCLSENLGERYAQLQATAILGDTVRSPIGLMHPKIPVRLPTGPDVVYDLEEILTLHELKNPMDRNAFTYSQIQADPGGLQKLLDRLKAVKPGTDDHEQEQEEDVEEQHYKNT